MKSPSEPSPASLVRAAAPLAIGPVPRWRVARLYGGIAIGLLLAALVLYGARSTNLGILDALGSIFMFMVLAHAWNVLGGYGGYLNFGMAAFFGVGAYTAAILSQGPVASPFLAVAASGLVTAGFGALVGIPTLRLRGAYFAIVTLMITFAVQLVVFNLPIAREASGIYLPALPLPPRATEQLYYFGFLLLAVAATALAYAVERSAFGWALVAIREDEDAAEVLGVRTTWVKLAALIIGACMAGVVGGVYAYRVLYIEPTGTFAIDTSLNAVLMTVLGGAGTWQGPLIGTTIVMLLADILRVGIAAAVNRVIFGLLLIAVALFVPKGVMGLVYGARGRRFTV